MRQTSATRRRIFTALLVSALSCLLLVATARAAPPAYDVRVLVDISGSMKHNDPQNLRRPALRLLADLLPDGARAGIWTFGGQVDADVPHAPVGAAWRQRAAAGIERVHSRGQYTDIEAAVDATLHGWESVEPAVRRSLILLTDGVVDISKDPVDSLQSRQRVLGEQLERILASGAAVYTVALSARADHALLQELSAVSGGWYQRAEDAAQLQRIFLRLFEKTAPADTLPLDGDGFEVDTSVDELTLLAFTLPGTAAPRLAPPVGEPWGADDAPDGVRWRAGDGYALVTVPQPTAGHWRILGEMDPDNRVMVVTDLRLAVDEIPNLLLPGHSLRVTAELQQDGRRIDRTGFLELVGMHLEQRPPVGQRLRLELRDDGGGGDEEGRDGRFSARLADTGIEGEYELLLRADGGSFQREHRHHFSVRWPVDVDSTALDGEPAGSYRIDVTPRGDLLRPGSLGVSGELEYPDGRREALVASADQQGIWSLQTPPVEDPAGHRVHLHTVAEWRRGERIALSLPPLGLASAEPQAPAKPKAPAAPPAADVAQAAEPAPAGEAKETEEPEDAEPPLDWQLIGGVIAAINLLLAGLGWWSWRRRHRRGRLDELDLLVDDEVGVGGDEGADEGGDEGGDREAAESTSADDARAAAVPPRGGVAGVEAGVDADVVAGFEAELELPGGDDDELPSFPAGTGAAASTAEVVSLQDDEIGDHLVDETLLAEMVADVDPQSLDVGRPGLGGDDGEMGDDDAVVSARG